MDDSFLLRLCLCGLCLAAGDSKVAVVARLGQEADLLLASSSWSLWPTSRRLLVSSWVSNLET